MDYPQVSTATAAEELNRLHSGIEGKMRSTVQDAIRAGEILSKVKEQLGHGDFLPWLKLNCQFSQPTAWRYVSAYRYADKLSNVNNLQEAYKQVETLEAQAKMTEDQKARQRIAEYKKTGNKPDGWRRGTDDKLVDEQRERDKRFSDEQEKWKLKNEEKMRESEERSKSSNFDYEEISKITNAMVANINKRQSFKESIRVSHEGKDDPFVDAIMDYLETLQDDSRRIEACYNIIKVCKGIANQLQAGGK